MADVFDKETRSFIMSKIRGKNTKPEIKVRKFLFSKGFRYRNNQKSLPGKPDIALRKYNTVVMVNGCFWHGHDGCSKFKMPKSNVQFWVNKISNNKKRDIAVNQKLAEMGWRVIRIWECEIHEKKLTRVASEIKKPRQ